MKTSHLTLATVLWSCAAVCAEEAPSGAPKAGRTNAPAAVAPGTSTPVTAPSVTPPLIKTTLTPPTLSQPLAADESVVAQLPLVLSTTTSAATTPGEDTKRRLQAPTPEQMIEKYGSVGFLFRQPDSRNFFEMINPFAPEEFGGKPREVFNRDPNLKPGATLPRTFIRDGIRNEPELKLISFPF